MEEVEARAEAAARAVVAAAAAWARAVTAAAAAAKAMEVAAEAVIVTAESMVTARALTDRPPPFALEQLWPVAHASHSEQKRTFIRLIWERGPSPCVPSKSEWKYE